MIAHRLLTIVEDWFYGVFDAICRLLAEDSVYPEDGDVLASTPSAPALQPLQPEVRRALARVRAS